MSKLADQYVREAALASIEPNIGQADDLPEVMERIVRTVADMLGISGAAILLRDAELDAFTFAVTTWSPQPTGHDLDRMRTTAGATGWIVVNRTPLAVADITDSRILATLPVTVNPWLREANLRAFAGVPLLAQEEVVGVLYALHRDPRDFLPTEMHFMAALARRGALAISNVRLFAAMQAANQEMARAVRLKNEFLANMSHELRTPLNAILGMAESLQEGIYGQISHEQGFPLQVIQDSGRHLLALINDILDLSQIEAGQLEINRDQVHLPSLCQSSLCQVRRSAQSKQIQVTLDLAWEIREGAQSVWADEHRLKQVLVNLLSNAIKFTPAGGQIGLGVSYVAASGSSGASVRFDVWDTGIGIAQEQLPHLFQPFAQLDSSLSRHYNGTGLGLALVRRMVDIHGGRVQVESQVGVGSRFTVLLPCHPIQPLGQAHLSPA